MEPDVVEPMKVAIQRWSGVSLPNEAARTGLADMAALIAELERVRVAMVFEDEPSSFDAALRDLADTAP